MFMLSCYFLIFLLRFCIYFKEVTCTLAKLNISNSTWPNDTGMGGILYVHVLLSFHICSFYLHFQEVTSPARLKHFKFNMTAVNAT